ncbi:ribosome small subunit-dependent GTPase A [Haloimpatiens sp. FM7330]|uniref:ribosome small subunit-dependent GTPase A n=1 Tax=Haloimpatiens sp. FM7330 TaxID=3298610 RepID=UPI0036296D05
MKGIIVKGVGGLYHVKGEGNLIKCKARGKFRHNKFTPMVGDIVEVCIKNNQGVIEEIYPRKNQLIRPFVSNITQAFVVVTLKHPDINLNLLNSFLILCEANKLKTLICINKIDLVDKNDKETKHIINMIESSGYEIVLLNAKEGIGLEKLNRNLDDEVTVFCGPSGVGKSTILNNIIGKEIMKTGEISDKLKRGKHTTRHSELIEYGNGFIVDTPGFSSLDISFINRENLKYYFPEFLKYEGECKFSDCLHFKEPGCKIKDEVSRGTISKERYEFYIKTLEEISTNRRNRK